MAAFPLPTRTYISFPSLEAELPVNEQVSILTAAEEPDPAKLVLIEIAPPFPELLTLFPEKEHWDIFTKAPLPMVIAPPYLGPEPEFVELLLKHVPLTFNTDPETKTAPPVLEVFSLSATIELLRVTTVVASPTT